MSPQTVVPSTLVDALTLIRQWSQNPSNTQVAEVDDIEIVIGDGSSTITTGIKAAIRVDFNAIITGCFLHAFRGSNGSISFDIAKALYVVGTPPVFTSIVALARPTITAAQYSEDTLLTGWTANIYRGEVLRFQVISVSSFTQILLALRIRRLEP